MARSHGSLVLVGNNNIMYLVSSHPLNLGADIVMHSTAKFIARHCDLMGEGAYLCGLARKRLVDIGMESLLLSHSTWLLCRSCLVVASGHNLGPEAVIIVFILYAVVIT
ncbi:hypothetical protein KY285_034588 [Solanum tuberosum]|nr:hypothetical protein KY285_034588 [Solanum tuberosum]